jgi:hypothetical protein
LVADDLQQAEDVVFELIGVHTPAQKEEWMLSTVASMIDSQILSLQQHDQIFSWLPKPSTGKQVTLEILYRASRDGWQCQDFHSR